MTDLVFFPGAGSFGGEFQQLVNALGSVARVIAYPGRFGRDFGVPAESFEAVVRACTEQITDWGLTRPVLFGHSFGAYVAYATALSLQATPAAADAATASGGDAGAGGGTGAGAGVLVVAGATAPGRLVIVDEATRSPQEAADYLRSVDPSALSNAPSDEWREIIAETVVDDMRLLREFAATSPIIVHCPIIAVRGEHDPLTTDDGIGEWKTSTDGEFTTRTFEGAHSDFLSSSDCASWLNTLTSA
jgi:surfactin synthase thioesterase subunit